MKKNYRFEHLLFVGIDPGVNTGYSVLEYHTETKEFKVLLCESKDITDLMDDLTDWGQALKIHYTFFFIEDARERKWFGTAESKIYQKIKSRQPITASELSTYKGMLLGAGSVRRDCAILESLMQKMEYNYHMIAPKNNKTKTTAAQFKALTGWKERTNEHGRDAAMLVLSNYKQALKTFEESR